MNHQPSVSVIVPLYNKADQIGRCLESLRNQTYNNYQVLVVDDGSTDNSYEIAQQYISENIQVLRKSNGGVSSARNYGLDNVKSDFVVFVDSDDWVDKNYISDFFLLNEYSPNSIGIQAIEIIKAGRKQNLYTYENKVIYKSELLEYISKYALLHTGYPFAKLYRVDLLNKYKIRFIEDLPTHEDHVFVWTYMQYIDEIILCANSNYKYIIDENPESLSKALYTPDIFIKASNALLNALDKIKENISLKEDYYERAKTDFGLTQRIRAILSAYIKGYDKEYRKKLLTQEFVINKSLYKKYKSKRMVQDIGLKTIIHTPVPILDTILSSVIFLLGLRGKDVRLFIK